jgi:hypothetical protein
VAKVVHGCRVLHAPLLIFKMMGLGLTSNEIYFIGQIENAIKKGDKINKRQVEKIALYSNILNKNYIKELAELTIVKIAREIAQLKNIPLREKYDRIVEVYYNQVNLSHRTSRSMMLQQYSTPAPISFLASNYIYKHRTGLYFEPSAGNGLLTIAIPYNQVEVNEVDDIRLSNLKSQPFKKITNKDASKSFNIPNTYDGIITNPPFGTLDEAQLFGKWKIKTLDHAMALHALNTMKDDGRAAIIIGGHTQWDEKGRIQAGKNRIFFNYLYSHYHVEDVILIDGHKLYSRQGTAFDTRLILIDGRKEKVEGVAPLKTMIGSTVVKSFDELYARIVGKDDSKTNKLIDALLKNAAPFRHVEFTDENKHKELGINLQTGEIGYLKTPIGLVKLSIEQIKKIENKFRQNIFGLINPTLTNPLIIAKSKDKYGNERESFIKTFYDSKKNTYYFVSFVKDELGNLEVVSNHNRRESQIKRILSEDKITYQSDSITALLGFTDKPKPNYSTLIIGISLKFINKDTIKNISKEKIKLKLKLQKAKLALLRDEQILGIEDDIKINKQIIMYKRELLNNDFVFDMGKPDEFLIKYGIPNKQIRMRYDVLEKAINKHKILAEEFKNFNKKINNPKAIYKSKTHPNTSKLILTELKNIMENPVVVAIWTNKNNVINDITTVHAKFRRQLRNWENEGLTLYKKRNFEI